MAEILLILATAVAAGWAALQAWQAHVALRRAASAQHRLALLTREVLIYTHSQERVEELRVMAEASVDGGTQIARSIHHAIAAIPFGILEAIPITRDTARVVHRIHDFTADGVYGTIGAVNRLLGPGGMR